MVTRVVERYDEGGGPSKGARVGEGQRGLLAVLGGRKQLRIGRLSKHPITLSNVPQKDWALRLRTRSLEAQRYDLNLVDPSQTLVGPRRVEPG